MFLPSEGGDSDASADWIAPDKMAERPEDLNLPNAVITRIIKEALPEGVNLSKEARSAIAGPPVSSCCTPRPGSLVPIGGATVLVLFLSEGTSSTIANTFAMKGKRKTLNVTDVMSAMEEMEFQRFLVPLKEALEGRCNVTDRYRYTVVQCEAAGTFPCNQKKCKTCPFIMTTDKIKIPNSHQDYKIPVYLPYFSNYKMYFPPKFGAKMRVRLIVRIYLIAYRREQKGKKEATEMKKKDNKDKKPDGDEQDKSREEEDEEEKMEEDEVVEDEEVEN
ncbi:unnamed protein product [Ranitomeya imitator]|uniref:Uncharacterized protein n=1 Tax=Ranitomeya imitator TaxID=111125 RepID=A0ABN9MP29_9NEOB|nr:unnamed protein product [Ranitomeya imitator]